MENMANKKTSKQTKSTGPGRFRVLVTGGAGFLGRYLIDKLLAEKCDVVAVVKPSTDVSGLESSRVQFVLGDIRDPEVLKKAMTGVDAVVHAAATMWGSWEDFYAINVGSTRTLLELARQQKVKRFVHISSVSVYDHTTAEDGHVFPEDAPFQKTDHTFYSKSKMQAEEAVREYREKHNLPVVVLRPGALYGAGGPLYPAQLGLPLGGHRYGLIGNGRKKLPLCHVRSVAEAVWLATKKPQAVEQAYNLVEDEPLDRLTFLRRVKEHLYPDLKIIRIPYAVLRTMSFGFGVLFGLLGKKAPLRPLYLKTASREMNYPADKIKKELGWKGVPDVEQSVLELLKWYKEKETPKRDFPVVKGQVDIPSQAFVNVGVVGCGAIAGVHLDILRKIPNVRLVGLADPSEEARTNLARKYHIRKTYDSLKAMLEAEKLDVVHILAPVQLHAALAIEAMNRNCHVLVEKPMAVNAAEARKMIATAKKKKVKLTVGHNHLFDSVILKARKIIASGQLGRIASVESWYGASLSSDGGNRAWSYDARNAWFYRAPGGLYQDYISHPISLLTDVMGDVTTAKAVAKYNRIAPFMNSDELRVLLENDTMVGVLNVSLAVSPRYQFLKVYGTQGTLHVDLLNKYAYVESVSGVLPKTINRNLTSVRKGFVCIAAGVRNLSKFMVGKLSLFNGTERMIRLFYRSVLLDEPVPVTAEEGLLSMQIMDEIWRQIHSGNGRQENGKTAGRKRVATGVM